MRKYNELNYTQISTGSYLRSIGGPTHRLRGQERRSRLYDMKQIDSKLPWVCSVIDHRSLPKMKFIHFSYDEVILDVDRVVLSAYCESSDEKVD